MASVLDAFVRFLADTTDVQNAMGPGGAIAKGAAAGGQAAGTTFGQRAGNAISRSLVPVGATAGLIFASGLEGAVKFEDQLRTINTVAMLTDEELAAVGDQIQEVSRETGKSTDDLAAGFYDLVSAGVPASEAIGVLRDSAKFATGALGTTAESVDLVTSVMNAYGLEAADSARITDVFAKAVADGKVTAAQLGQSIANIAPLAAEAGVSMEEVSSGFAIMTAQGVPAAQAATRMRAAISALLTPNEQLNRIQQQTGKNFGDIAREKGLAVALEELRIATEESGGALEELGKLTADELPDGLKQFQDELGLTNSDVEKFTKMAGKDGAAAVLNELATQVGVAESGFAKSLGSIDAYGFALSSTGANAETFQGQITETMGAVGIANEQYEEKSKSAAEQGKRTAATIQTFLQDVAGPFVQTLGPWVFGLGQLAGGLGGLISPAKLAGAAIGGLVGKLGKLVATSVVGLFDDLKLGRGLAKSLLGRGGFASALTGGLTDAFASGLSKIPGAGKVTSALKAAGALLGSPFGMALGLAAVAVIGAMLLQELSRIRGEIDAMGKQIGTDLGNQIAKGSTESLLQSKGALEKGIKDLWVIEGVLSLDQNVQKDLQAQLDAVNAELAERARTGAKLVRDDWVNELAGSKDDLAGATREAGDGVAQGINETAVKAGEAAGAVPEAIGAGILEKQGAVDTAMSSLRNLMENELTVSQEIWKIKGLLMGEELRKALVDKRPGVRDEAQRTRDALEARLAQLVLDGGTVGKKMMDELKTGIRSKDPETRAAAQRILDIVNEKMDKAPPAAKTDGANTTEAFADGLLLKSAEAKEAGKDVAQDAKTGLVSLNGDAASWGERLGNLYALGLRRAHAAVKAAGNYVAGAAAGPLRPSSPPKEGPLHTIDEWGASYVDMIVNGLLGGRRQLAHASADLAGGLSPIRPDFRLGEAVMPLRHQAETLLQATSAPVADTGGACDCDGPQRASEGDLHVHLETQGVLPFETVEHLPIMARRIREQGILSRRVAPAVYPLKPGQRVGSLQQRFGLSSGTHR